MFLNDNYNTETKLMRRKIKPLATKNPMRSANNPLTIPERSALYVAANPILGFSNIIGPCDQQDVRTQLMNLMADKRGAFLSSREVVYAVDKGSLMLASKKYSAASSLEDWLSSGVLKTVSTHDRHRSKSREALLRKKMPGLSAITIDMVTHILNSDIFTLMNEAENALWISRIPNRQIFSHPSLNKRQTAIGQYVMDLAYARDGDLEQVIIFFTMLKNYKQEQTIKGITVGLLWKIINDIFPGRQIVRKRGILTRLLKIYGLDDHYNGLLSPTDPPPYDPAEGMKALNARIFSFNPRIHKSKEAFKAIKYIAALRFVDGFRDHLTSLTEKIRDNLNQYQDKDDIDLRQRAKMLKEISPIPLEYESKSINSPRIYSQEPDNLFSCRKAMRLHALQGLGAVDIDLKSCHTYILLATWPKQLPLLKQGISQGNLWDIYQKHYAQHGQPFHKKAVKAMHYASVLGGGKRAFQQAIHRYNLDNPDNPIHDWKELIRVHTLSPIYKELKGLLRHIQKSWEGKTLELPTGEKFRIKGFRRYKNKTTGEIVNRPGNLLTALSAYLQSYEVLLMSNLILRTEGLYIPILWQHDGLTIIPRCSDCIPQMQKVLDEICEELLSTQIKIPLDITYYDPPEDR